MSRNNRRRPRPAPSGQQVPRTARVGELLREIIADELARIDDDRLHLVAITAVEVDPEFNRAIVAFDPLGGEDDDEATAEALADHRVRLQGAIGRQFRARKTPVLTFRPDSTIRAAERIDQILRDTPLVGRDDEDPGDPDGTADAADPDGTGAGVDSAAGGTDRPA